MASRKVLLGIAAAAVIAIAYFAVKGFPPVGPGAEGTVGAAKRYQSAADDRKDVVLQDEGVQSCLQSDAFRQLIADKEARAGAREQGLPEGDVRRLRPGVRRWQPPRQAPALRGSASDADAAGRPDAEPPPRRAALDAAGTGRRRPARR